jgi:hypothetical protein
VPYLHLVHQGRLHLHGCAESQLVEARAEPCADALGRAQHAQHALLEVHQRAEAPQAEVDDLWHHPEEEATRQREG